MSKVEIIKSALKFLVQKQIEQGSWGFSDADDNEISWDEVIRWLEQQPCEDCISRQYLIERATSWDKHFADSERYVSLTDIQNAPSVTPQPKRGEWIPTNDYVTTAYGSLDYYRCSCCGEDSLEEGDYCPNCGADMREVQDDGI